MRPRVRLTNFMLLAYLIYVLTLRHPNCLKARWLAFLGKHSIQVYTYSVCIVYFIGFMGVINYQREPWSGILIDIILVATLTLPAFIHQLMVSKFTFVKKCGL